MTSYVSMVFHMFFFSHTQPGSAYMPINVDGSPGKGLRGQVHPGSVQVTGAPPVSLSSQGGLGRSGSPATNSTNSAGAAAASLIRQQPNYHSNYAVASAVAQAAAANHSRGGITSGQGGPSVDHVRSYYQGVANIGQGYTTSRGDPSATVFVRNPVRLIFCCYKSTFLSQIL